MTKSELVSKVHVGQVIQAIGSMSPSRSRSHSPARDFQQGPDMDDQSRGRSAVPAQVCRNFTAGRCRRGNNCRFIHVGSPNIGSRRLGESSVSDSLENRHSKEGAMGYLSSGRRDYGEPGRSTIPCKHFLRGTCDRGASCKFVHHPASCRSGYDFSGGSYNCAPFKTGVCKVFAAGNCRNGNHCRYSHHSQEAAGPKRSENGNKCRMGSADQNHEQFVNVSQATSGCAPGQSSDFNEQIAQFGQYATSLLQLLQRHQPQQHSAVTALDTSSIAPVPPVSASSQPNHTAEPIEAYDPINYGMVSQLPDGNQFQTAKEIRPFKFSLAEFVKELLNPAWEERKVSKEVYKVIVKKVVHKVLDALPAAHIPQSNEEIDQYLSDSKLKLSKLVQAYLEKYQKANP